MPTTEEIAKEVYRKLPISASLGTRIYAASGGRYSCGVPLDERTRNHFGTVHAAVQWSCVELVGGLIWLAHFNDQPHFFVVRSSKIEFLLPARSDITVDAEFPEVEIEAMKRALAAGEEASFVVRSAVRRADGRIVARAECDYLLRRWRGPANRLDNND